MDCMHSDWWQLLSWWKLCFPGWNHIYKHYLLCICLGTPMLQLTDEQNRLKILHTYQVQYSFEHSTVPYVPGWYLPGMILCVILHVQNDMVPVRYYSTLCSAFVLFATVCRMQYVALSYPSFRNGVSTHPYGALYHSIIAHMGWFYVNSNVLWYVRNHDGHTYRQITFPLLRFPSLYVCALVVVRCLWHLDKGLVNSIKQMCWSICWSLVSWVSKKNGQNPMLCSSSIFFFLHKACNLSTQWSELKKAPWAKLNVKPVKMTPFHPTNAVFTTTTTTTTT